MIPFHNLHALVVLFIVVTCIQNAFGAYLSTPVYMADVDYVR